MSSRSFGRITSFSQLTGENDLEQLNTTTRPSAQAPMDPVEDTLREVESLICGLDFEVAVGLDLNGQVLFWRTGDEDSVSPTPEEWALVQDKILTHNHPPRGASF